MKSYLQSHPACKHLLRLVLCATLVLPLPSLAGSVALATAPLANSTTSSVLPNLMFIIDNSGSMGQDYTPDYMSRWEVAVANNQYPWTDSSWSSPASDEKNCKDSADDDGSVSNTITTSTNPLDLCVVGDVPYMTSAMNSQYYNPAVRYAPGVNADGSSKPSQTDPTSVLTDGYNKQNKTQLNVSTTTINLTTSYPDRVWCTKDNPTSAELTNTSVCRKNSDYLYPDATYKYGRSSSGNSSDVWGVYGAPYYYDVVPTEYCTTEELKTCTLSSVPTGSYTFPAKSRWCSDPLLTTCQSVKTSTYKYPRYVGASVNAVAASGSITMRNQSNTNNKNVSSIKVNNIEILNATISGSSSTSSSQLATAIANGINAYASNPEYTASASGNVITITSTAAAGATANGAISYTATSNTISSTVSVSGGVTGTSTPGYAFTRTNIVPSTATYPKATSRTDCVTNSTTCTYAEEITNFGNWYAYYRTRMQAMKSAVSQAFSSIDNRYRVGFITIANQSSSGNYLPIDIFNATQKSSWYTTLFGINPSTSTPLRSALTTVGRIFAGQKPVGTSDPMQYSCQQNFALLTTDGYWNTDSNSDVKDLNGNSVGNLDSDSSTRPMYEGPTATSNTLADAAKYYYDTDLRTTALGNCTGSLGVDVCYNDVPTSATDNNPKQHMTTFTLGLGVDGTLAYSSDYLNATSGDYYDIKQGTRNWSVPVSGNETTVDDLWHAAVNGRGQYFSAKDPSSLSQSLNTALSVIKSKLGAGAAAATSTLNPVTGDNYAYVASYTTVKWYGNLEGRTIDISTGETSKSAFWCVEDVAADTATGVTGCTGTLGAKVHATSDDRNIYTFNGSALVSFTYDNLSTAQKAYFTGTGLSQWSSLTSAQQTLAAGSNLVNFLRGQTGYEDRSSNTDKLYRYRERVLGDAVESQPAYIGPATFSYSDKGYSSFKAAQASRAGTVYLGTNDGMLHAFAADTGQERWAYVPTMVLPNLWKLADKNYATMHTYYVNGSPAISDVCTDHCSDADAQPAVWKTILVGGLNGGGRGYYALDITDPAAPVALWEFTTASDADVGFSFGQPVITKKSDGTWVVLVTSGYNNTSTGNGQGYLYVLNAKTGTKISKIGTGTGDTTTPSGLAKVVAWVEDAIHDNSALYVYGGDLLGNLWRFDINSAGTPFAVATLSDGTTAQPITTRPELAKISDKRVVYVATGKYLEVSDLTNTQQQSVYAIKDDATTTLASPRTVLVAQTLTDTGNATRTSTSNVVDFSTGRGWFVDFLDSGERNNVDMLLVAGTLLVPSNVPSNTICSPGGYGWFNYFDYKTGGAVANSDGGLVAQRTNATIVGVNVWRLPNGTYVPSVVTNDDPTPKKISGVGFGGTGGGGGFGAKRSTWRELIE